MIKDRSRPLNAVAAKSDGKCIVYIMSRDQRLNDNHALLLAQKHALNLSLPLLIVFNFVLSKNRSREHYQFMVDGLTSLAASAGTLNIPVLFLNSSPKELAKELNNLQPAAIYFDFSPLKGPIKLRHSLAKQVQVPCFEVDTHNIIPAWLASDHQEFAAHTFRPKIHKNLAAFLQEPVKLQKHPFALENVPVAPLNKASVKVLPQITKSGITLATPTGEKAATEHMQNFIDVRLANFALDRNDPSKNAMSELSPYLHFGQISSLRVALETIKAAGEEPLLFKEAKMASAGTQASRIDGMNALLEEMIVRKELSDNFCLYAPSYLDFSGVPAWAQSTLKEHASDSREFTYSREDWEDSKTHDTAWNAAQNQLRTTGKIHGYMRMYWAKKMLEWSASPEQALADCVYLNDKYSIDGGDPNGYVGILWSLAGLHDRPWTERTVFGKIRYMNYAGLKRKFDIESYIAKWNTQTNLL